MFVHSDHAEYKVSCISRSVFLIHVNTILVQQFSKKQSIVVTSVFSTEFVTMKQGMYALRGLRYDFRMMRIHISGPLYIYGNNLSVVCNRSKQESILRNKINSVCNHAVCEQVTLCKSLVGHVPSTENITDLMTKILCGQRRKYLVSNIFYDIHDGH